MNTLKSVSAILLFCVAQLHALENPPKPDVPAHMPGCACGGGVEMDPSLHANMMARLAALRAGRTRDVTPPAPQISAELPAIGSPKVLALLIDFFEYPAGAGHSQPVVHNQLFGAGSSEKYPYESLRGYYSRASYGKLNLQGTTLGWYRSVLPRFALTQSPAARENLIKEALNSYDSSVDFSQFDSDGDGNIDYLIVIYTGPNNGWGNHWWAYRTKWQSAYKKDGKGIGSYVFQFLSYDNNYTPDTELDLSVVIHETGHQLGLPDLYAYPNAAIRGGIGAMGMMHGNNGEINGFLKWVLGWNDSVEVVGSGEKAITLFPNGSYPNQLILAMPGLEGNSPPTEFFAIENRSRSGNDQGLNFPVERADASEYNGGLAIWHIDATKKGNQGSPQLIKVVEADQSNLIAASGSAQLSDLFTPGMEFGPTTTPNSNRYNGSASGVNVSSIRELAAGDKAIRAIVSIDPAPAPAPIQVELSYTTTSTILEERPGFVAIDRSSPLFVTATTTPASTGTMRFYINGIVADSFTDTTPPYQHSWSPSTYSWRYQAEFTDATGRVHLSPILEFAIKTPGQNNGHFNIPTVLDPNFTVSPTVNTTNAIVEDSEPKPLFLTNQQTGSTWFRWKPQSNGRATLDTLGSAFDTVLAVYVGGRVNALTQITANDDVSPGVLTSRVTFDVSSQHTYQISVSGFGASDRGNCLLNLREFVPKVPSNDFYLSAKFLSAAGAFDRIGDTSPATTEANELPHITGLTNFRTVWYFFQPNAAGTIRISTEGSNYDTVMALYTVAANITGITKIAENDDAAPSVRFSKLAAPVEAGVQYSFAIGSYNSTSFGELNVRIALDQARPPNKPVILTPSGQNQQVSVGRTSIHVSATDLDGDLNRVEVRLLPGNTTVATIPVQGAESDFNFLWEDLYGFYKIVAVAIDDGGRETVSDPLVFEAIDAPTFEDAVDLDFSGSFTFGSGVIESQSEVTLDGTDAAHFRLLAPGYSHGADLIVDAPGQLVWWWKTDSVAADDTLSLDFGGSQQVIIPATPSRDWERAEYFVDAEGAVRVNFRLRRGFSEIPQATSAYIDAVEFISATEMALDTRDIRWTTNRDNGAPHRWKRVTTDSFDGIDSLQPDIPVNEAALLSADVFGPATVDFVWKASGAAVFEFSHNGTMIPSPGQQWTSVHLDLPMGRHKLEWNFLRTSASATGAIDQVRVEYTHPEISAPLPVEIDNQPGYRLEGFALPGISYQNRFSPGLEHWSKLGVPLLPDPISGQLATDITSFPAQLDRAFFRSTPVNSTYMSGFLVAQTPAELPITVAAIGLPDTSQIVRFADGPRRTAGVIPIRINSRPVSQRDSVALGTAQVPDLAVPQRIVVSAPGDLSDAAIDSSDYARGTRLETYDATTGFSSNRRLSFINFPFGDGWPGAHFDPAAASPKLSGSDGVTMVAATDSYHIFVEGKTPADGMLFAIGTEPDAPLVMGISSETNYWKVRPRTLGENSSGGLNTGSFAVVFIGFDTPDLIGGRVNSQGVTQSAANGQEFTSSRTSTGVYRITPTDPNRWNLVTHGMIICADNFNQSPGKNFFQYGEFLTQSEYHRVVESYDSGAGSTFPKVDAGFSFFLVPFDVTLVPKND